MSQQSTQTLIIACKKWWGWWLPPPLFTPALKPSIQPEISFYFNRHSIVSLSFRTAVEDGEVFRPERFLEEGYGSSQWLPFGIGPHACIGNKFAFSEMKILISNLIKNFKFEPVPDLKIHRKYRLTLRPVPDVELFVTCRWTYMTLC